MCRATGNSHDAPVSQPFFKLETCFDFSYFTQYLEYHSLFGMGPKKRSKEEPVPSQELLEIRAKKQKLSKWMEGGAEGAEAETQGPEDQPGKSAAPTEEAEVEEVEGKNNHMYMYTLFIKSFYKINVKKPERTTNVENNAYSCEYALCETSFRCHGLIMRIRANTH